MAKIGFVSFEIHPTVKGGCGVLLHNAAHELLSLGHEVIFILDMPAEDFEKFNEQDRLELPHPERCRAYLVWDLITDMQVDRANFTSEYELRAYQFYHVASKVNRLEKLDLIEFIEYTGAAYHALSAKVAELDFPDTRLVVRLHGALELIDRLQSGTLLGLDRYLMYGLEHQSLRLAETVLSPSQMFLEKTYRPLYEPWFGEAIVSRPPLVNVPIQADSLSTLLVADGILFYGRLHGIKGVDTFVDAAISYLGEPQNPARHFYLVGYDSGQPPGKKGSYQAYLKRKIPAQFQDAFQFTGQLTWAELRELLPRMLFAVIPSHFESFCYAAHELYEAGLPLIVADLPGLKDDFTHEQNALLFDGSVSDLRRQMQHLSTDAALRKRLSYPYPLPNPPLTDFYLRPRPPSWISVSDGQTALTLLVVVLADNPLELARTLACFPIEQMAQVKLVVLRPSQVEAGEQAVSWFLGKLYSFEDETGAPLLPSQVQTAQAVLVLKAGDVLEPNFIPLSLSILQRQPQISFVASWKYQRKGKWTKIETFPLDAAPELAPFVRAPLLSRAVLRTQPGALLLDLFDPRAGRYGELACLWRLDQAASCGLTIPLALVEYSDAEAFDLASSELDYLINFNRQSQHAQRLARVPLTLKERARSLAEHSMLEGQAESSRRLPRMILTWLRQSPLNSWLDHLPWLKKFLKSVFSSTFRRTG